MFSLEQDFRANLNFLSTLDSENINFENKQKKKERKKENKNTKQKKQTKAD